MKQKIIFTISLLVFMSSFAQEKKAYALFSASGKKTSFPKLLKKAVTNDVILFGEIHNNPIAHWLELELSKELSKERDLVMGAEMFDTDQQQELNLYLQDSIDESTLSQRVKLWSNYNTDYKPLVDFAKAKKIPFVATNIPKLYATLVYKEGFEAVQNLVAEEQQYVVPQPIPFDPELPQYKNILTMMGDHGTPELVKAQAIKDANMAHFIFNNFIKGSVFLHFNGAYHSDFKEGILWYLNKIEPEFKTLTISTVEQHSIEELEIENINKADFIICVPNSMTKTY